MGRELRGTTFGVIGYGRIARYRVRSGAAFGMRVVVAAPETIDAAGVHQVPLDDLLARPTSSCASRSRTRDART